MRKDRDYKQEAKWASSEEQKKNRAARNKARRQLMREGKVRKGDGLEVDHQDGNPRNNKRSNWKVMPASKNRSKQ